MDLVDRLNRLKQRYSVDDMVAYLRKNGVHHVHRTTLFRWLKNKSTPRNKAYLAVQILEAGLSSQELELRVAEPDTILALPSTFACKKPVTDELPRLKQFGVNPKHVQKPTGGETLDMLTAGEVDVAIAATVLVQERAESALDRCARLCTLSQAPLIAIAVKGKKKFSSLQDLNECIVGFPQGSAVPSLLNQLVKDNGIRLKDRKGAKSYEDAAKDLRHKKIDLFISWDGYSDEVEEEFNKSKRGLKAVRVLERAIGNLSQDIAVNLETANPTAVRGYVECLLEVIAQLQSESPSFPNEIRRKLGETININQKALRATTFRLREFELDTLLRLWRKEVQNASYLTDLSHPSS